MRTSRGLAGILLISILSGVACKGRTLDQYMTDGDRHFAEKKFAEAMIDYRNAVKKAPNFVPARLGLGEAYLGMNDGADAAEQFMEAAILKPNDVDLQLKAIGIKRPSDSRRGLEQIS